MDRHQQTISYMKLANRIASYVDQHINEPLELQDLANTVGLSKYHLHRTFRACTGVSLGEFIRRCKMYYAYKVIRSSESKRSILEIALNVGYESHSSFSRAFHKSLGITPSQALQGHSPKGNPSSIIVQQLNSYLQPTEELELDTIYCTGVMVNGYKGHTFYQAAKTGFVKLGQLMEPDGIDYAIHHPVGITFENPWVTEHNRCRFFVA